MTNIEDLELPKSAISNKKDYNTGGKCLQKGDGL